MSKSTDAEVRLRVQTVAEMLIKAQSRQDIFRYNSENWGVTQRQCENYIAKAWEIIKENSDREVESQIQLAINRYENLFKKSYKIQDYRECRQVQKDKVDLLGLAEAQKIDLTSKGEKITGIEFVIKDDTED